MRWVIVLFKMLLILVIVAASQYYILFETERNSQQFIAQISRAETIKKEPSNERPKIASAIQQVLFHIYRAQIAYIVQDDTKKRVPLKETINQEKMHYAENSAVLRKFVTEQDLKMRAAIEQSVQDFFELADKAMDQADDHETEAAWNIADNLSESAFNEALDNLEAFSRYSQANSAPDTSKSFSGLNAMLHKTLLEKAPLTTIACALLLLMISTVGKSGKSLGDLAQASEKLVKGDLDEPIPLASHKGDSGELSRNLSLVQNHLKDRLRLQLHMEELQAKLSEMRQGEIHFNEELSNALEALKTDTENTQIHLGSSFGLLTALKQRAETTTNYLTQVNGTAQELLTKSDEFSAALREIGPDTQKTGQLSQRTSSQARKARDTLSLLFRELDEVAALADSAKTVATHTGLLALNAGIEASRLGESGQNLSQSSQEIKAFAQETVGVADTIHSLLSTIKGYVLESDNALEKLSSSSQELEAVSGTVAAQVKHYITTTQELALIAEEAVGGTQRLDSNLHQISLELGELTGTQEALDATLQGVQETTKKLQQKAVAL